jgi:hypothetical protein
MLFDFCPEITVPTEQCGWEHWWVEKQVCSSQDVFIAEFSIGVLEHLWDERSMHRSIRVKKQSPNCSHIQQTTEVTQILVSKTT